MNERHANRKAKQSRNDDKVVRLATKPHQDKSLYQSFTRWNPLTEKQALTSRFYDEKPQSIIVQAGSAGTGKTAWGLQLALRDLVAGECDKVMFLRNIVSARETGFLPGSMAEKFAPFVAVAQSLVNDMFGRGDAFELLTKSGKLVATCSSFLQGHTFDNCRIVADEIQNMNWGELSMLVTRMGENSKMIMCGDDKQDMLTSRKDVTGWYDIMDVFDIMPSVAIVRYDQEDIVRSDIVREFIIASEKYFSQLEAAEQFQ